MSKGKIIIKKKIFPKKKKTYYQKVNKLKYLMKRLALITLRKRMTYQSLSSFLILKKN